MGDARKAPGQGAGEFGRLSSVSVSGNPEGTDEAICQKGVPLTEGMAQVSIEMTGKEGGGEEGDAFSDQPIFGLPESRSVPLLARNREHMLVQWPNQNEQVIPPGLKVPDQSLERLPLQRGVQVHPGRILEGASFYVPRLGVRMRKISVLEVGEP